MYRKYIEDLKEWNSNPRRKPLIVWGARQVGKSYLIKDLFAEEYYRNNYVYIDCRIEADIVRYCENHMKTDEVINFISLEKGKAINSSTLLIFDEVQECLPVITMLKYFCQDHPEIPVIATGSMVRIRIQREARRRGVKTGKGFLFPVGKINQLTVYPMNFGEYLINRNRIMYENVLSSYRERRPLDDETHKAVMDVFKEYLLVGGMPEAVRTFLETNSYLESRKTLIDVYDNYLDDMELYQASPESIVRSRKTFDNIYVQLNKESKNFKSSLIEKGAKGREYKNPIDWLTMAQVVIKSSLVKERVTVPLKDSDESVFRLYLADIGMFSYQSGINATTFISDDGINVLSGIFFENYVATELTRAGRKLFYWKGKRDSEFEFVIENDSTIVPIDVKKGRGSMNSLEEFRMHNRKGIAVKISINKFGYDEKNGILTIPFYDAFAFADDLKNGEINL